jgi:hypothetical protein
MNWNESEGSPIMHCWKNSEDLPGIIKPTQVMTGEIHVRPIEVRLGPSPISFMTTE